MAYIDRDDAIRTAIDAHIKAVGHGISHVEALEITEAMENIPTADVEEVKHAYWIPHKPMIRSPYAKNYDCSECGNSPIECGEYCNKCGAKMDGDIKNTDHFTDVGKMELAITDFHIGNVSKMVLPWFSADNKSLLEKVLFFHKMEYPSEMDMELIVIIEGAMQPTILFYDGTNFYSEEANGDICFHKVTHWMPLPAPPEKGA